eukprot:CAMPEP_0114492826 /NCGR_PEP_ID=MMETSP0109-20121206/3768_1 /TAXON_ID=29199 /ORGANISM="Chlorarachnion reptans, Strain CCCM449" /LENGTH=44 /DNA_ID= /DNA_START= /DNA_END= /DNA_ORIENTATION=
MDNRSGDERDDNEGMMHDRQSVSKSVLVVEAEDQVMAQVSSGDH